MTINLTKAIRKETISNAMTALIKPRHNKIIAKLSEIARTALVMSIPKEHQKWLNDAPAGIKIDTCSTVSITQGGWDGSIDRILNNRDPRYSDKYLTFTGVPVPPKMRFDNTVDLPEVLKPQWDAAKKEYVKLALDLNNLRAVTSAALDACRTYKQVEERYPDLVKYLPKQEGLGKSLVITSDTVAKTLACVEDGTCK